MSRQAEAVSIDDSSRQFVLALGDTRRVSPARLTPSVLARPCHVLPGQGSSPRLSVSCPIGMAPARSRQACPTRLLKPTPHALRHSESCHLDCPARPPSGLFLLSPGRSGWPTPTRRASACKSPGSLPGSRSPSSRSLGASHRDLSKPGRSLLAKPPRQVSQCLISRQQVAPPRQASSVTPIFGHVASRRRDQPCLVVLHRVITAQAPPPRLVDAPPCPTRPLGSPRQVNSARHRTPPGGPPRQRSSRLNLLYHVCLHHRDGSDRIGAYRLSAPRTSPPRLAKARPAASRASYPSHSTLTRQED